MSVRVGQMPSAPCTHLTARMRGERQRNAALLQEIAKRRQIERERERLLDELAAQNVELAAKNAELDSYAHTVSHDLKSPLVTIRGFRGSSSRLATTAKKSSAGSATTASASTLDTMSRSSASSSA